MTFDPCPRCGDDVGAVVTTDPGIETMAPCGCRVAVDGGSVHPDESERDAVSVDGMDRLQFRCYQFDRPQDAIQEIDDCEEGEEEYRDDLIPSDNPHNDADEQQAKKNLYWIYSRPRFFIGGHSPDCSPHTRLTLLFSGLSTVHGATGLVAVNESRSPWSAGSETAQDGDSHE